MAYKRGLLTIFTNWDNPPSSRLALSLCPKNPCGLQVEMLVAKAVRGLAPAVTGQSRDPGEGRGLGLELVGFCRDH